MSDEQIPVGRFRCGGEVRPGDRFKGFRVDWVFGTPDDFSVTFTFDAGGGGSCQKAQAYTLEEFVAGRACNLTGSGAGVELHDRDKVPFSQLALCSRVFNLIDDMGIGSVGQRTINAVARACTDLMAELLADPHVSAKAEEDIERGAG